MKSTRSTQARPTGAPRSLLKKTAASVAMALALVAPAAHAGMVTFEDLDPTAFSVGDTFISGDMKFTSADTAGVADIGSSLSGAIFDSTDAGSCFFDCPLSNGGKYYAGLADGVVYAESGTQRGKFKLNGFDASFIGLGVDATYPTIPGYLRVMGWSGATSFSQTFVLDPKGADGFEFARFNTNSNFSNRALDAVAFFAFGCTTDSSSSCKAYGNYNAQFALDNVDITNVPEPASMLTMLLGLAGMGAVARRRSK